MTNNESNNSLIKISQEQHIHSLKLYEQFHKEKEMQDLEGLAFNIFLVLIAGFVVYCII